MTIRVYLNNKNTAASQIFVYRDTKKIEDNALPTPVATLAGDAKYYDEQDNLFYDVDYHYRVKVVSSTGDEVLSADRIYRLGADLGIGSKNIIMGNETLGLMDVIDPYDYGAELLIAFSTRFTIPSVASANINFGKFIKYIRNGKIYYTYAATSTISGATAFNNGLVSGGSNIAYAIFAATKAKYETGRNEVIVDNRKYAFHFASVIDDQKTKLDIANTADYSLLNTPAGFSELIDLMRIFGNHSLSLKRDKMPFRYAIISDGNTIACADNIANSVSNVAMILSSNNLAQASWTTNSGTAVTALPIFEYMGTVA